MLSKFPEVPDENIFSIIRIYLKCGRSLLGEVESGIFSQSDNSFLLELWQMPRILNSFYKSPWEFEMSRTYRPNFTDTTNA